MAKLTKYFWLHEQAPTFIGWYDMRHIGMASILRPVQRRWWNGKYASLPVHPGMTDDEIENRKHTRSPLSKEKFKWRGLAKEPEGFQAE